MRNQRPLPAHRRAGQNGCLPQCLNRCGGFPQGGIGPGFNDRFGDVVGNIHAFTSNIYAFTSDGLTQRQPSRAAGKKLQRGPGSLRLQPEEACQTPVGPLAGHPTRPACRARWPWSSPTTGRSLSPSPRRRSDTAHRPIGTGRLCARRRFGYWGEQIGHLRGHHFGARRAGLKPATAAWCRNGYGRH